MGCSYNNHFNVITCYSNNDIISFLCFLSLFLSLYLHMCVEVRGQLVGGVSSSRDHDLIRSAVLMTSALPHRATDWLFYVISLSLLIGYYSSYRQCFFTFFHPLDGQKW